MCQSEGCLLAGDLPALVSLCGRVGVRTRLVHVQIEDRGTLVFGASDHFDPNGVRVNARFGEANLERLLRSRGIASYELVKDSEENGRARTGLCENRVRRSRLSGIVVRRICS